MAGQLIAKERRGGISPNSRRNEEGTGGVQYAPRVVAAVVSLAVPPAAARVLVAADGGRPVEAESTGEG